MAGPPCGGGDHRRVGVGGQARWARDRPGRLPYCDMIGVHKRQYTLEPRVAKFERYILINGKAYRFHQSMANIQRRLGLDLKTDIWDANRLERLRETRTHTATDKAPVYALYVFSSLSMPIIRVGAIGVDRVFDRHTDAFSISGNSVSGRFRQYNALPAAKPFRSGVNKGKLPSEVLPWNAQRYRYIWGVTLTGDITPSVVLVAENMIHQRLQQSGLR